MSNVWVGGPIENVRAMSDLSVSLMQTVVCSTENRIQYSNIWFMFLVVTLISRTVNGICKIQPECGRATPKNFKFSGPITGPRYYSHPGPLTLTCNASGDIQKMYWERTDINGSVRQLNYTTFGKVSSFWIATLDNYLSTNKPKFSFICVALDICCNKHITERSKTIELRKTKATPSKCIKDVLIIVDASALREYRNYILCTVFLRALVDNLQLNVSPEGSHISLMTFGYQRIFQYTRISISMKSRNKTELKSKIFMFYTPTWIDNSVKRTDVALLKANEIFKRNNPLNHREDKDDVIILLTDGPPTTRSGKGEQPHDIAIAEAKKLRDKGIVIVGIAAGNRQQQVRTLPFLKNVSTAGQTLPSTFLNLILLDDRIVHAFCPRPPPGPSEPRNLSVVVHGRSLTLSWLKPEIAADNIIDHYLVSWGTNQSDLLFQKPVVLSPFQRYFEKPGLYNFKVQGVDKNGISGEAVYLYNVTIERRKGVPTKSAENTRGVSTDNAVGGQNISTAIIGGVAGSGVFICLAAFSLLFIVKKIQNRRKNNSIKEFESWIASSRNDALFELEQLNEESELQPEEISYVTLLKDWEISPNHLHIMEKTLGAGQFGIVKQASYTAPGHDNPELVAVKMLKDTAKKSDISDLLAELETLKKINEEPHPNVIRFIGGCSVEGKLMVVTEFCSAGNLRKFLRKSKLITNLDSHITSTLNDRQLLKIAVDVASGMAHLSNQKFVHRDLAARNIFLSGELDNVAKISDFGLARDIGSAEEYIRSNQNLLPVKWMALESLIRGIFTTASDVWSFGVLLYEIVTLGEEPYKAISPYNIINHVGSGGRMPKPPHCSSEIYEIMSNCWKVNAKNRPTFSEIHQRLHDLMINDKKSYIHVKQLKEGKLSLTIDPTEVELIDEKNDDVIV
ncbi:tyrosine-protein kinase receptor Tie-1-like [Dendronephthya gigantea]|uniref:tyrosine-protein kinase receptor Tie-1-like n=1 Tax=Dendronephthya gigantea TaxID=151771 RepID=UPI001068D50C|nr:tyrosine-protein kinase receptor Tie-1-like [Dendronephthya gigantea]